MIMQILLILAMLFGVSPDQEKHWFVIFDSDAKVDSVQVVAKYEINPARGARAKLCLLNDDEIDRWIMCVQNFGVEQGNVKFDIRQITRARENYVADTTCTINEAYRWLERMDLKSKDKDIR